MISISTNNGNNTVVLPANENGQSVHITSLFNKAKSVYECAERNGYSDTGSEQEILHVQKQFKSIGHNKGVVFCLKALAIIFEKRGDLATDCSEKIHHFEAAHDNINEAVLQAAQIKWDQPSLLKRQGIIKYKLGDALHRSGDHYNANLLESGAFKIFGKMLQSNPDYAEGLLAYTSASFNKLKWHLRKLMHDLEKTEYLFKKPKNTKHRPDAQELTAYRRQMEEMRSTINMLLAITN